MISNSKRREVLNMKKLLAVMFLAMFVIISQTSDRTYSVNDGSGSSSVVVVS